jgi:hypothetical protein
MRKLLIVIAVAALIAWPVTSIASDKSKNDAVTLAETLVNSIYECKAYLPLQSLRDAEGHVPSILRAGGFSDSDIATITPRLIALSERWQDGDPPETAIGCGNVRLTVQRNLLNWIKSVKEER